VGWGAGNIGAILCLFVVLYGVIGLGRPGFLGIGSDEGLNVRVAMIVTALWFAVFAVPLFAVCPDRAKSGAGTGESIRAGLRELGRTLKSVKKIPQLILFLAASAIYRDGLATLFAVGGLYAAGTFGMDFREIMYFAIIINVATGVGAFGFAFFEDRIGSKTVIMLSLAGLIASGIVTLLIDDKYIFMAMACVLGIFIGPVQSAGRTLLVKLSPPEKLNEFFGLYALSGKSVSFMGPFAFAGLTQAFDSQRAGVASIIGFWALGLILIYWVRVRRDEPAADL
jgi:UMF1 family MFS transporter